MNIGEVFSYTLEHWDSIMLVCTSVVTAAAAIAACTPTPKDDAVLKVVRQVIDWLALNVKNAENKSK